MSGMLLCRPACYFGVTQAGPQVYLLELRMMHMQVLDESLVVLAEVEGLIRESLGLAPGT